MVNANNMRYIIGLLLLFPLYGSAQQSNLLPPIMAPGVLKIESYYNEGTQPSNTICLKTKEGNIVDSVYVPHDDYSKFTRYLESRVYYPQETIRMIFFDSYPLENGHYKVFCNGGWYYINNVEDFTKYMSWGEFVMNILFFDTTTDNPIRVSPTLDSKTLQYDYNEVCFMPKKVDGDWVYVDVMEDPGLKLGCGWLRWRNGNKLLLTNLYFSI